MTLWQRIRARIWYRRFALSAAGIALVAVVTRLANLAAEPYWGDEVLSLDVVLRFDRVADIVRYIRLVEFHPPLYYVLLKGWVTLFGAGEAATRSLSVVFSLATVPLAGWFASRVFGGRRVGYLAALLVAVLPMMVEYGQEARPYALFCFLGLLAVLATWEQRQGPRWQWSAAYVLASTAGLYLHYSYAFIFLTTVAWQFAFAVGAGRGARARGFTAFLAAHAAVTVLYFPSLVSFLYKHFLGSFEIFGMVRAPYASRLPEHVLMPLDQAIWMTQERRMRSGEAALKLLGAAAAFVAAWAAALRGGGAADADAEKGEWRDDGPLFVGGSVFLMLALFVASPQSQPYTPVPAKHLILLPVLLAVLVSAAVSRLRARHAAAAYGVFVLSVLPATAFVMENDGNRGGMHKTAQIGELVQRFAREGDLGITFAAFSRSDIQHYMPEGVHVVGLLPTEIYDIDLEMTGRTLGLAENESQVRVRTATDDEVFLKMDRIVKLRDPKRLWLFDFAPDDIILTWLAERGWKPVLSSVGLSVGVMLYEAPAESDVPAR